MRVSVSSPRVEAIDEVSHRSLHQGAEIDALSDAVIDRDVLLPSIGADLLRPISEPIIEFRSAVRAASCSAFCRSYRRPGPLSLRDSGSDLRLLHADLDSGRFVDEMHGRRDLVHVLAARPLCRGDGLLHIRRIELDLHVLRLGEDVTVAVDVDPGSRSRGPASPGAAEGEVRPDPFIPGRPRASRRPRPRGEIQEVESPPHRFRESLVHLQEIALVVPKSPPARITSDRSDGVVVHDDQTRLDRFRG